MSNIIQATPCSDCIYEKKCNSKIDCKGVTNTLENMTYGNGPNDDYSLEDMLSHFNMTIKIICNDFKLKDKVTFKERK